MFVETLMKKSQVETTTFVLDSIARIGRQIEYRALALQLAFAAKEKNAILSSFYDYSAKLSADLAEGFQWDEDHAKKSQELTAQFCQKVQTRLQQTEAWISKAQNRLYANSDVSLVKSNSESSGFESLDHKFYLEIEAIKSLLSSDYIFSKDLEALLEDYSEKLESYRELRSCALTSRIQDDEVLRREAADRRAAREVLLRSRPVHLLPRPFFTGIRLHSADQKRQDAGVDWPQDRDRLD